MTSHDDMVNAIQLSSRIMMSAIAKTEAYLAKRDDVVAAPREALSRGVADCDDALGRAQMATDALMPHVLCGGECSSTAQQALLAYAAQIYLATRLKVALTNQLAAMVNPS